MRPSTAKKRRTARLFKSPVAKTLGITTGSLIPLILLWQQWNHLLHNPASTLTGLLGSIFLLQIAYIVLLLPVPIHPKKTSSVDSLGEAIRSQITPLLQSVFLLIPSIFLIHTFIIFYGAPLTTRASETLLSASHIALLSTFPLSASVTLSHENIARVLKLQYYSEFDILTWTYWGAVGTLVGAWLGAAPIPLDWDRDWQKWPITVVVGAYLGHALGLVLSAILNGVLGSRVKEKTV